jgi:ATP-dependent Clp protease ATP-binding subunit ClpC
MTSNAGAQRIVEPKHLGFGVADDGEEDYKKMKEGVMEEVKRLFKPEFINRIDEILVFRMLTQENICEIVKIMLASLNKRTSSQLNLSLEVTEDAVAHLAESGFDKNYGARPVRRAIQTQIEDELAEKILQGEIAPGDRVKADFKEEKMVFSKL